MNNRELLNTYNSSIDIPSDRVFITNNVPVINEKTDLLYEHITLTFSVQETMLPSSPYHLGISGMGMVRLLVISW